MEQRWWIDLLDAVLMAVLLLLVEHWGPWQDLTQKRFHNLVNYILGVLALIIPLSILMMRWGLWSAIGAIWAVVIGGGLAVMGAYWVDGWIATRRALKAAQTDSAILHAEMIHDPRPEES